MEISWQLGVLSQVIFLNMATHFSSVRRWFGYLDIVELVFLIIATWGQIFAANGTVYIKNNYFVWNIILSPIHFPTFHQNVGHFQFKLDNYMLYLRSFWAGGFHKTKCCSFITLCSSNKVKLYKTELCEKVSHGKNMDNKDRNLRDIM